jgi:hypothetical protein
LIYRYRASSSRDWSNRSRATLALGRGAALPGRRRVLLRRTLRVRIEHRGRHAPYKKKKRTVHDVPKTNSHLLCSIPPRLSRCLTEALSYIYGQRDWSFGFRQESMELIAGVLRQLTAERNLRKLNVS